MNSATQIRSAEEKARIVQEAGEHGMAQTCRKHGISHKTYYQWRDKFETGGIEALRSSQKAQTDPELALLRRENERLKRLVAEKELIISVKDELLNKTHRRPTSAARLPI